MILLRAVVQELNGEMEPDNSTVDWFEEFEPGPDNVSLLERRSRHTKRTSPVSRTTISSYLEFHPPLRTQLGLSNEDSNPSRRSRGT
jgi:hypothetical protein